MEQKQAKVILRCCRKLLRPKMVTMVLRQVSDDLEWLQDLEAKALVYSQPPEQRANVFRKVARQLSARRDIGEEWVREVRAQTRAERRALRAVAAMRSAPFARPASPATPFEFLPEPKPKRRRSNFRSSAESKRIVALMQAGWRRWKQGGGVYTHDEATRRRMSLGRRAANYARDVRAPAAAWRERPAPKCLQGVT
jgi:hypothetical protein